MKPIYVDNAATSYPKPECVYRAMDDFSRNLGSNPGRGSSRTSLQAGSVLLDAREALAALFNIADSSNIAFTMNITEALNVGLKGFLKPGDHVITTSMEHNSVARPLYALSQQGVEWTRVACASDGSLDPEDMRKAIRKNTRMICMLHASNLTGTIMPVAEVGRIAHEHGLRFMLDTAQSAGVIPIDVGNMHIDILTFTGHKSLFGPQGTGGIYVRPGIILSPLKQGGTGSLSEELEHPVFMPDLLESGTPNTPGIAGLLAGIDYIADQGMAKIRQHEEHLTNLLLDGLKEISGIKWYGPADTQRRTAVVPFNIDGVDCGELGLRLDHEYGISTRSGLHCTPLAHATIGTLKSGACRISPGYFNTEEDIRHVVQAIHAIASSR